MNILRISLFLMLFAVFATAQDGKRLLSLDGDPVSIVIDLVPVNQDTTYTVVDKSVSVISPNKPIVRESSGMYIVIFDEKRLTDPKRMSLLEDDVSKFRESLPLTLEYAPLVKVPTPASPSIP